MKPIYPQEGYAVYAITNTVNGKRYIGACKADNYGISGRKACHLSGSKSGSPAIREDMKIYDRDVFDFEVLCHNMTAEEAHHLEKELIKDLGCIEPNGYNRTTGGKRGGHPSQLTVNRMVDNHKGMSGRKHTSETRRKMSESRKRRSIMSDIPKYQPIVSLLQKPKLPAAPVKPADAKVYDKATVEQVIYFLDVEGYTKKSIAEAYDVKESTITKWVKEYNTEKESEKDQAAAEPAPAEEAPEEPTDDTDNDDNKE